MSATEASFEVSSLSRFFLVFFFPSERSEESKMFLRVWEAGRLQQQKKCASHKSRGGNSLIKYQKNYSTFPMSGVVRPQEWSDLSTGPRVRYQQVSAPGGIIPWLTRARGYRVYKKKLVLGFCWDVNEILVATTKLYILARVLGSLTAGPNGALQGHLGGVADERRHRWVHHGGGREELVPANHHCAEVQLLQ